MKKAIVIISAILAFIIIAVAFFSVLPKSSRPAGTGSTGSTASTAGTTAPEPPPPMPEPTPAKYFKFEYFGQIMDMQTGEKLEYYTISARNTEDLPEVLVIPAEQNGVAVRYIAENGFAGAKIEKLVVPSSIDTISKESFAGCTSLKEAEVYSRFEKGIGGTCFYESCFEGCTSLESVKVYVEDTDGTYATPKYISGGIREKAFKDCESLTHISFPAVINSIHDSAFENCTGLKSVIIPDSVYTLLPGAFRGCDIESVRMDGDNGIFISTEDYLIIKKSKSLAWCTSLDKIPTDGTVTHIENFVALERAGVTEYTIPDFVESIGEYAFASCKSLKSITLSDAITEIPAFAFCGLEKLERVDLKNVTSIGGNAFYGCISLREIELPDTLKNLAGFSACTGLTGITLPAKLESIGGFDSCTNITEIALPSKLGKLSGFNYCTGLTAVSVPKSVRTVLGAFNGCSEITEVTLPSAGRMNNVFNDCAKLRSINILQGIEYMIDAFNDCPSLSEVVIPEGTSNFTNCFNNCRGLAKVTLPKSVDDIRGSFMGCPYLMDIYYGGTMAEWENVYTMDFEGELTVHCTDGDIRLYHTSAE